MKRTSNRSTSSPSSISASSDVTRFSMDPRVLIELKPPTG